MVAQPSDGQTLVWHCSGCVHSLVQLFPAAHVLDMAVSIALLREGPAAMRALVRHFLKVGAYMLHSVA